MKRFAKRLSQMGPGAIVAAAFIGPGTVTTASRAGAGFGFALLWALVFSILATFILQEMCARLGVVGRLSLGQAIREEFANTRWKYFVYGLVLCAIVAGNAAFETGNLVGGALGLSAVSPISSAIWGPAIGLCAGILLWFGSYRLIERCFVAIVFLMSGIFLVTAIWIHPPMGSLFTGLVFPTIPSGATLTVIALIGTTVVPYNLFLHSAAVRQRWSGADQMGEARWDLGLALVIGGAISCAIVVTAAMAFPMGHDVDSAADMARQLEPVLGRGAVFIFAFGLFAAGMTSAITAPLAAAYAAAGILGWSFDLKSRNMRVVWIMVIGFGVFGAGLEIKPTTAIILAQYANGLLLPLVALFLMLVMNRSRSLGKFRNTTLHNILGSMVVIVTLLLALKSLGLLAFFG